MTRPHLRALVSEAARAISAASGDSLPIRQAAQAVSRVDRCDYRGARLALKNAVDNSDLFGHPNDKCRDGLRVVGEALAALSSVAESGLQRGGFREGAGPKPSPAEERRSRRTLWLTDDELAAILPHLPEDVRARMEAKLGGPDEAG